MQVIVGAAVTWKDSSLLDPAPVATDTVPVTAAAPTAMVAVAVEVVFTTTVPAMLVSLKLMVIGSAKSDPTRLRVCPVAP